MNIFYLDHDIKKNVQYYVDKHIRKMAIEAEIMLRRADGWSNHPCTIWAHATPANYEYLYRLGLQIGEEYRHRYGKGTITTKKIIDLWRPTPSNLEITPPFQSVAENCKGPDPVEAYRKYYRVHKTHLFTWTNRPKPEWLC